jgi:hypothetical protein
MMSESELWKPRIEVKEEKGKCLGLNLKARNRGERGKRKVSRFAVLFLVFFWSFV